MKVWIVCDNKAKDDMLIVFESKEKAQDYVDNYGGFKEDCWIYDKEGTQVH